MSDHAYCPLCDNEASGFLEDRRRHYYRCRRCQLVFVQEQDFPSPAEERAIFDLHENSPDDVGYRKFLSRLCDPLTARLAPGSQGLDFGCGPGPALPVMLGERGYPMERYDPYFAPDRSVLNRQYDFVTATEVVEHFHNPGEDWDQLWSCVKPGGLLGIMTKLVIDRQAFSHWHYKDDETHVCFYSHETLAWISKRLDAELSVLGKDVFIFRKPTTSPQAAG